MSARVDDETKRAIAEVREHARDHEAAGDCALCSLWRAYICGDVDAIDALMAREGIAIPTDVSATVEEAIAERLLLIRSEWGEADWTARDINQAEPRE